LHPLDEAPVWFQAYATQQAAQVTAQTAQLTAQTAHLTALTAQLAFQMETLRHEVSTGINNSNIMSFNRSSLRGDSEIRPLESINGNIPENFPATRRMLFELTGPNCNTFLTGYGLPIAGTLSVKRDRLAQHIGLIL